MERGFTCICFTEHVDKTTEWYDDFRNEVVALRERFLGKLKIYYGIEVRAVDYEGNLNAYPNLVEQAEVVIGVVHSYPDGKKGVYKLNEINEKFALDLEYKTAMGLLENKKINILGHPGSTYEQHFGEFPLQLYKSFILKAKEKGVAIELNPQYQRNFEAFVRLCIQQDVLVSLGSNAHSVADFGKIYERLSEVMLAWT